MKGEEARIVLGFPPNYRPSRSEIKAAYKTKVWSCHPDLFPPNQKPLAESSFKSISEAYTLLLSPSGRGGYTGSATCSRVVKTGVPRAQGGSRSHALIQVPFLLLVVGTVALGGFNASRAYRKQKESYPSHNPFLP